MTRSPEYKTLTNGSIDYGHYIRKSHDIRSQSAHSGLRWVARFVAALLHRNGKAQAGSTGTVRTPMRAGRAPSVRPSRAASGISRRGETGAGSGTTAV